MTPRPRTRIAAALAAAALVWFAALARAEGAADLTAAVAAWLASLSDDLRDAADYRFDDEERFDLRLAPIGLEGLRRRRSPVRTRPRSGTPRGSGASAMSARARR